jgi:quercetin dioxygenase-like cupin family protein
MISLMATEPTVMSAGAVGALAATSFGGLDGVSHKVLWQAGSSMAGLLVIAGGHHLGQHAHRRNQHHLWVVDGHAVILGTTLGPGGYAHIPSGIEHDIDARATEGCRVFYLYEAPETSEP